MNVGSFCLFYVLNVIFVSELTCIELFEVSVVIIFITVKSVMTFILNIDNWYLLSFFLLI